MKTDRIGIVGFSIGGRAAYIAAATESNLSAAGLFYCSDVSVSPGDSPAPLQRTHGINCPVIGFFGDEDLNPSQQDVENLHAEMIKHDKVHESHSYPGAGHSFMSDGTRFHRPEAAKDAWKKLMDWFRTYLQN